MFKLRGVLYTKMKKAQKEIFFLPVFLIGIVTIGIVIGLFIEKNQVSELCKSEGLIYTDYITYENGTGQIDCGETKFHIVRECIKYNKLGDCKDKGWVIKK